MERRKMLNVLGLSGLTSWGAFGLINHDISVHDERVHFLPTFQDLLNAKGLKEEDVVITLGFYQIKDGGGGQYQILASREDKQNSPGRFHLNNGFLAQLINCKKVNYQLFGARGDGIFDDGQAILAAHEFANQENIPVENLQGEYYISHTRGIPIEASVSWGQSVFHIDEKHNTNVPVFHIRSRHVPVDIPISSAAGEAVLDQVKPGVQVIPELEEYANHLIHLYDDQDRIAFRAGNYNQSGRAREELFYVSQKGRILGDIVWNFQPTVTITAYSAEVTWLVVDGGTFFLSGDTPMYEESPYSHNGILVTRSRTRIRRQWTGIEEDRKDDSMTPRSGFYYFMKVYDVMLEDIRLNPREKNRPGEDHDVPHGTYGIGGNRVLEFSMDGVVAEGTGIHWGVLGTNMMKNIKLRNCRINRFDVHFHLWNLSIRDCNIGYKGITVTGGGKLHIEHTVCLQHRFINFRQDYGAKWDGDVYISHCVLRPPFERNRVTILEFEASDFDYGYPIGIARSIEVQQFVVDYAHAPDNDRDCWLMAFSEYSVTSTGKRLFFPDSVQFRDIKVRGRKKGVRIAHIVDCNGYQVAGIGKFDGDVFLPNSIWVFEDVELQKVLPGQKPEEQIHLGATTGKSGSINIQPDSPHIQLMVRNCPAFSAYLPGVRVKFHAFQSLINQVVLQEEKPAEGSAGFEYCDFIPVPAEGNAEIDSPYALDTELGTTFLNCVIHLPLLEQKMELSDLSLISFMELNKRLQFSHINTRLSPAFILFLKGNNVKLSKNFKRKLMLHSG